MNIIKKIWIKLFYLKLALIGDIDLNMGKIKKLPCMDCGKIFRARVSMSGSRFVIDNRCLEHR
jgi:hypothetical protein